MRSFTWEQVRARRLARNHLLKLAPHARLVDVVGDVCGIQAQVMSAAELAISARVTGLTQQGVRDELWKKRRLIKTYGPRGTLHLLPAREMPLWMAAMRGRELLSSEPWYKTFQLKPAQADTLLKGIGEALDGRCLTREELADEVSCRVGSWAKEKLGAAWGYWLGPPAFLGLLCFGPPQGSKVTFVRLDQWIDCWKELEPHAALADVCRRYLRAYGPATHQDFGNWFWLKPDQARSVFESLADELEQVSIDRRRAWLWADAKATRETARASVRLLPQYDCYILGSNPRASVVPEEARARIRQYGRGQFEGAVGVPVLLVDGVVAGMWERRERRGRIQLKVESFHALTAEQRRELEAESQRVGKFFDTEVELSLGKLGNQQRS